MRRADYGPLPNAMVPEADTGASFRSTSTPSWDDSRWERTGAKKCWLDRTQDRFVRALDHGLHQIFVEPYLDQ